MSLRCRRSDETESKVDIDEEVDVEVEAEVEGEFYWSIKLRNLSMS